MSLALQYMRQERLRLTHFEHQIYSIARGDKVDTQPCQVRATYLKGRQGYYHRRRNKYPAGKKKNPSDVIAQNISRMKTLNISLCRANDNGLYLLNTYMPGTITFIYLFNPLIILQNKWQYYYHFTGKEAKAYLTRVAEGSFKLSQSTSYQKTTVFSRLQLK